MSCLSIVSLFLSVTCIHISEGASAWVPTTTSRAGSARTWLDWLDTSRQGWYGCLKGFIWNWQFCAGHVMRLHMERLVSVLIKGTSLCCILPLSCNLGPVTLSWARLTLISNIYRLAEWGLLCFRSCLIKFHFIDVLEYSSSILSWVLITGTRVEGVNWETKESLTDCALVLQAKDLSGNSAIWIILIKVS